jgi:hypothetical protein
MDPQQDLTIGAKSTARLTHERAVMFELPAVISDRIDQLVESLEIEELDKDGTPVRQRYTSRKELVAALILDADDDPEVLRRVIEHFRTAKAGEVSRAGASTRIRVPGRGPGLRPTSDQAPYVKRKKKPPRRNRRTELSG